LRVHPQLYEMAALVICCGALAPTGSPPKGDFRIAALAVERFVSVRARWDVDSWAP
jgi:hypothetical protein